MATTTSSRPAPAVEPLKPTSLWRGRVGIVIGIVLLGLTLRYAVTGLSPLLPTIMDDMGIGVAGASFIGMLPTLSFGIAGFLAPVLIRRWSPELTAVTAMLLAFAGAAGRALTDSVPLFIALTAVSLLGMGFGNVVGAPLVKKYFPDRQAVMLTVFALLMQAGATLPAMTAIPVADAAGWRVSIASWSIFSLLAALPWVIQLVKRRTRRASDLTTTGAAAPAAPAGAKLGLAQLITSPIAVGTALFYAMASLNTYAMLAWLPKILQDRGMSEGEAGTAFAIFTFLTLPMAAVAPIVANKMKNPFPFAVMFGLVYPIGYIGLIVAPDAAMVWAFIMGIGGGAFPFAIAMFNLRTRTPAGSGALAGFAMGVGYLFGTLGPLLGGTLLSATGNWTAALIVFSVTGAGFIIGGRMMTKRGRYLEDNFDTATPVTEKD